MPSRINTGLELALPGFGAGEQTGGLDEMLSNADFYEEQVETAASNLLSLLEPIMIVFLGAVVGGIVASIIWNDFVSAMTGSSSVPLPTHDRCECPPQRHETY